MIEVSFGARKMMNWITLDDTSLALFSQHYVAVRKLRNELPGGRGQGSLLARCCGYICKLNYAEWSKIPKKRFVIYERLRMK